MLNRRRHRPGILPTRPRWNVDAQRMLLPTSMSARPTGRLSASRSNAPLPPRHLCSESIPKQDTNATRVPRLTSCGTPVFCMPSTKHRENSRQTRKGRRRFSNVRNPADLLGESRSLRNTSTASQGRNRNARVTCWNSEPLSTPLHFPMQKPEMSANVNVYWGTRQRCPFWRHTGDIYSSHTP